MSYKRDEKWMGEKREKTEQIDKQSPPFDERPQKQRWIILSKPIESLRWPSVVPFTPRQGPGPVFRGENFCGKGHGNEAEPGFWRLRRTRMQNRDGGVYQDVKALRVMQRRRTRSSEERIGQLIARPGRYDRPKSVEVSTLA